MAWYLGGVELPAPKSFSRDNILKDTMHEMINGTSKRDITSKKEKFSLSFSKLTQDEAADVKALYESRSSLLFSVDEGMLSIAERYVHVDIMGTDYPSRGSLFLEDFTLILTDVDSNS